MSPSEATEAIDSIYNMKKLSSAAHASALIDTFARYSLKQGQSYAIGQAAQEPRLWLGPKPLGRARTGLDRVINEAPGSPKAQAALAGRAGVSFLLKFMGVAAPLWGIKRANVYALMTDDEKKKQGFDKTYAQFEAALDEAYANIPNWAGELNKVFTIPIGRGPRGSWNFWYLDWTAPWMAFINHYAPDQRRSMWQSLINSNVIASPIGQAYSRRNQDGHTIPEGTAPGESEWPLVSALLPLAATQVFETYTRLAQDPYYKEKVAYELAKYLTGFKFKLAQKPSNWASVHVRQYLQEKKIKWVDDQQEGTRHMENAVPEFNIAERAQVDLALSLHKLYNIVESERGQIIRFQQELEDSRIR